MNSLKHRGLPIKSKNTYCNYRCLWGLGFYIPVYVTFTVLSNHLLPVCKRLAPRQTGLRHAKESRAWVQMCHHSDSFIRTGFTNHTLRQIIGNRESTVFPAGAPLKKPAPTLTWGFLQRLPMAPPLEERSAKLLLRWKPAVWTITQLDMLIEEGHDSMMQEMTKHLMLITLQYSWPPEGNAAGTVWVSAVNQVGETLKGLGPLSFLRLRHDKY